MAALGSPAGRCLAPVLHRAAYAAMGLDDWSHEAVACDEATLPGLLGSFGTYWAGATLAVPLPRAVLPLLDEVSELAMDVGGADTVVVRHGRSVGEHTGAHGIMSAIHQAGLTAPGSAVVLGGGAAACSALAALREVGVREPVVVVRERDHALEVEAAAGRLGVSVELRHVDELGRLLRGVPVVVSTLPAGAADALAPTVARSGAAVLDAVCSAWPTRLAKAAGFAGSTVVDGLTMRLHRTVRQIELLTGRAGVGELPFAAMRAAALDELARREARSAEPAGSGGKLM
ncbi:shikimate dehydrogenase [Streptomyces sp. NPDC047097]|uniref:shikimate dehydrogenase family protein n=1 Tax=Streptomyces sp. NPDC047097 TaxID=3155260 RepID=UPI0033D56A12